MAEKTCPVRQGEARKEPECARESCEWYVLHPDRGGACAMTITARRLQLVVDTLARILAGTGLATADKSKEQTRVTPQNPVWDESTPR